MAWPPYTSGTLSSADQPFAAGHLHALVAVRHLHILHLQRLLAAHHDPEQAFGHAQRRPFCVALTGAVAGAQLKPFARRVQQPERAHLRAHQQAGFARDRPERVIQVQGGIDGLADAGQRFKQARLEPQLLVEPGVVNDPRGGHGQRFQQFLVLHAKGVRAFRVHVEHPAHLRHSLPAAPPVRSTPPAAASRSAGPWPRRPHAPACPFAPPSR